MKYLAELKEKVSQYVDINENGVCQQQINANSLTYRQLRDRLLTLGTILEEENTLYVAAIQSGFSRSNTAIIAIQWTEEQLYMVGYAKEGLINQHTCERVFSQIETGAMPTGMGKNRVMRVGLTVAILVAIIGLATRCASLGASDVGATTDAESTTGERVSVAIDAAFALEDVVGLEETQEYNQSVEAFNLVAEQYNQAVQKVSVANIDGFPASIELLENVSEDPADIMTSIDNGNDVETILLDTEAVLELTEAVKRAMEIVSQITNPSEEWVLERLEGVDSITGMEAVTEENNPDGLLGQEGGYMACVYFSITQIESQSPSQSIVTLGTDGGGAIEVYGTIEEAQARCEYLGSFDGTILYTGSYAVVGTMVVRTSYALTGEDQYALTDEIIHALTMES